MSRSRALLMLCVIAVLAESLLRPQTSTAQAASPQPSNARAACASDVQRLCPSVPPGGGRILACLKQHKDEVSDGCKRAILSAMGKSSGDASSADSPAPAAFSPAPAAASPAPPAAPLEHHNAPVLRQPPHQVRKVNRVCRVNRRATLPQLLQPSREGTTS